MNFPNYMNLKKLKNDLHFIYLIVFHQVAN